MSIPEDIELVQSWIVSATNSALEDSWVPGATEVERRRLNALGSLFGRLIDGSDYEEIFEQLGDLRSWLAAHEDLPDDVERSAERILVAQGHDGLASLYAWTVTARNRRRLGTFFTSKPEVDWMIARWSDTHGTPDIVLDVGAGVGAFTIPALTAWPLSKVFAIDINPVTLGLLAIAASKRGLLGNPSSVGLELIQSDYVVWAEEQWGRLPGRKVVIGNPPYTRLQLLPQLDRERLRESADGLVSARGSLSAFITAATLKLLTPGDGLCLLLPAQWLEAHYAKGLRTWLWENRRRRVDLHLFGEDLFDGAQVEAVALLVGPESAKPAPFSISASGASKTVLTFESVLERAGAVPDNFRRLFSQPSEMVDGGRSFALSAFGVVRRGVATGQNSFFVLRTAAVEEHLLPPDVLRPIAMRLRDFPNDELTSDELNRVGQFLLVVKSGRPIGSSTAEYLRLGEELGASKSYLAHRRRTWFDLSPEIFTPDVIVGPSSKTRFRFVDNAAKAVITNNLYGITWNAGVDSRKQDLILEWLRSEAGQDQLKAAARTHNSGLLKIEPRALGSIHIPASIVGMD